MLRAPGSALGALCTIKIKLMKEYENLWFLRMESAKNHEK
jgi:hypothetical protein